MRLSQQLWNTKTLSENYERVRWKLKLGKYKRNIMNFLQRLRIEERAKIDCYQEFISAVFCCTLCSEMRFWFVEENVPVCCGNVVKQS